MIARKLQRGYWPNDDNNYFRFLITHRNDVNSQLMEWNYGEVSDVEWDYIKGEVAAHFLRYYESGYIVIRRTTLEDIQDVMMEATREAIVSMMARSRNVDIDSEEEEEDSDRTTVPSDATV